MYIVKPVYKGHSREHICYVPRRYRIWLYLFSFSEYLQFIRHLYNYLIQTIFTILLLGKAIIRNWNKGTYTQTPAAICTFEHMMMLLLQIQTFFMTKRWIFFLQKGPNYFLLKSTGPLWSWLYGSWIYKYLCNQYLLLRKKCLNLQ
jgi:hypothetical protein